MFLISIFIIETFPKVEFTQTLELLLTFFSLFSIIFYLLITAENKKYFQKQK